MYRICRLGDVTLWSLCKNFSYFQFPDQFITIQYIDSNLYIFINIIHEGAVSIHNDLYTEFLAIYFGVSIKQWYHTDHFIQSWFWYFSLKIWQYLEQSSFNMWYWFRYRFAPVWSELFGSIWLKLHVAVITNFPAKEEERWSRFNIEKNLF